jgi:hypothetical protein
MNIFNLEALILVVSVIAERLYMDVKL